MVSVWRVGAVLAGSKGLSSAEKQTLVAVVEQVAVVDGGARVSGAHGRRTIAITERSGRWRRVCLCLSQRVSQSRVGACGRALAASRATRGVKVESATISASASRAARLCPAERRQMGGRALARRRCETVMSMLHRLLLLLLLVCCWPVITYCCAAGTPPRL